MPLGMSWWHIGARYVAELMAIGAFHREKAFAIRPALNILRMDVAVFALERSVSFWVAVHAPPMHELPPKRRRSAPGRRQPHPCAECSTRAGWQRPFRDEMRQLPSIQQRTWRQYATRTSPMAFAAGQHADGL